MTGFGRGVKTTTQSQITVEARAVNHRFLEVGVKFPKEFLEIEMLAKKIVSKDIARGKVDLYLSIKELQDVKKTVQINWALVEAYVKAKNELSAKVPMVEQWTMSEISSLDQVLTIEDEQDQLEELSATIQLAVTEATRNLVQMREREGQELKIVMLQLKNQLQEEIEVIRSHSSEAVMKYRERLIERLKDVASSDYVEERVLTEVALYAEKVDITEELDRLYSHILQLEETLNEEEAIGRKLEFLMQEMHREVNTIGSKNQSSKCSVAIVQAKMILEKMREQVQNIE